MYDTINLRLERMEVEGCNFLDEIAPNILNVGLHQYKDGVTITGELEGLKVTASQYYISVKNSICKFYLGNNLKTLTRGDVKRAFEKLSDNLHLPMERAKVTRFDVAQNIIVKYPVEVYLNHLGELPHYKRMPMVEVGSLYYQRGKKESLSFYDKNKQQRNAKEPVPELYKGCNVLRYEQRHTQRLPNTFKRESIIGETLYNETFYMEVIDRWKKSYFDIRKINDITMNLNELTGIKEVQKLALQCLIEKLGGQEKVLKQIKELQAMGKIDRFQAKRLRDLFLNANKESSGLVVDDSLIKELDCKIKDSVRFYS